jgi:hypothetical protein
LGEAAAEGGFCEGKKELQIMGLVGVAEFT